MLLALTLALAAVAVAVGAGAAQASPARFTYELCDSALPGGAVPASEHAYSGAFAGTQNCATPGGWIGLVETESASGTYGALFIMVPETPGGFVEAETITAVQSGIGPENDPNGGLGPSHVYENGFPGTSAESTRLFQLRTERAYFFGNGGGFNVVMSCSLGQSGTTTCSPGPWIGARDIAATEVDPNPPKLTLPQGSLLAGGTLRGHQTLAVEASDEGGGLSRVEALVNGHPAGTPSLGSCALASVANKSYVGTVALSTTPCPTKLKSEWQLNTETLPFHDGVNSLQICASDFSTLGSPNTTCSPAQTVDVDNSCTNSPVSGGELLSAQFTKSHRETLTVGYGREAEVTGQLTTNAGDPVSAATLCVKLQTLGINSRAKTVGTVTTDDNGNYSYKVAAGPNREIVIGYRHDTAQVARDVRYYAHAHATLHAKPAELRNGERVRLAGKLPGPRAAERVVVLQANVPGSHRWITFRKATTGRRGHFHASYHFTSTTRTITYRFRALVPVQAGYPWVQGASRPTPVKVRR